IAKNLTGLPSLPASNPQASLGNAASPCSTISSKKERSSSIIAGATTVPARRYSLNRGSGAAGGELPGRPLGIERGDQQPARGLRVREHQLLGRRELAPVHVRTQIRV